MIKRSRTEKSKYKHITTGDYCTCAAYVAEFMCLKIAEKKGVSGLPFKFWSTKNWDWTFKKQLMTANVLIKKYGEIAVVKAIRSDEFKSIFSLNHPKVDKIISLIKINKEIDLVPENIEESIGTKRANTFNKKSTLSKLRDLDGKNKKD